ncbi:MULTISPECIES: GNAT family N-acetyltransferase [unclassified Schaalia]|uniref:GNAT family N-acetyltransferase n=1 Tax=unclassified Schaalia TaxID=2691889 RepID=UPI0013EE2EDB|nr:MULTISPECIES: GNAT family N-acetyltransferase [unclassified Schaalia]
MTGLAERLSPPGSVPYPGEHLGLRFRPMRASDAPAVYSLIRETETMDDTAHRVSTREIADMIEGRHGVDWVETIVGLDRERRICAVASVRVIRSQMLSSVGEDSQRAHATIRAYTHPHWRGRGIGRALLYWQDGRARQMLVDTYGSDSERPSSISNFVDAHMTDRRRMYIAAGFYAKHMFQQMYREIVGGETRPTPKNGYSVVAWDSVAPGDLDALHAEVSSRDINARCFGRSWDALTHSLEMRWSFVACDSSGAPIGYIGVSRPTDRWAATGVSEANIDILGIHPDHRGRSLTSALVRSAIAAVSASGVAKIGVQIDRQHDAQTHSMYEHLGFVDAQAEVFYTINQ